MNAKEIRSWREARGISQRELARRLGVSFRVVQNWEYEINRAPAYLAYALAHLAASGLVTEPRKGDTESNGTSE